MHNGHLCERKREIEHNWPGSAGVAVADVERAQQHYRDALGFEIAWLYRGKEIGSVSRPGLAIFFRKRKPPFEPAVHWVYAEDIDASYQELKSSGANIVDPLKKALGIAAIYRSGSGREPFLFPSRLTKRDITSAEF
ncbi:MAG: VOC family protein [Candidatus Acidiferrales bacterium]